MGKMERCRVVMGLALFGLSDGPSRGWTWIGKPLSLVALYFKTDLLLYNVDTKTLSWKEFHTSTPEGPFVRIVRFYECF